MGKTNVSQHIKHDPVNQITGQDHPRLDNPVDDQPARDMFQLFRHVLAECLQDAATLCTGLTRRKQHILIAKLVFEMAIGSARDFTVAESNVATALSSNGSYGQTKRPFSNRLENRQAPWPTKERSQPGCH